MGKTEINNDRSWNYGYGLLQYTVYYFFGSDPLNSMTIWLYQVIQLHCTFLQEP